MPGGGGSCHEAIRQEPHRAHAPSRPRPLAQRRLPLGPRRRAARPEKPSEIRSPSRPRPRSWPCPPISRRSPHQRCLRHARGQDHLRSEPRQPKGPKPRKTHLLNGGGSPPIGVKIALDPARVGTILGRCKTQHLSRRINLKSCCGDFPPLSILTASPDKPRRSSAGVRSTVALTCCAWRWPAALVACR